MSVAFEIVDHGEPQLASLLVDPVPTSAAESSGMSAPAPVPALGDAVVEASPIALIGLDAALRAAVVNPAGRIVLERRDGLELKHGELRAAGANGRALGAALRRAVEPGCADDAGSSALLIERPRGLPYAVTVSRLDRPLVLSWPPCAQVLVSVVDPDLRVAGRCARVRALYGLTRSETALAAGLADGRDLKTVAEELRLTEASARQYLARVFAKTGTSRQSELVRLLLLTAMAP